MKVDWFTVIAQAINFLILLWLMKRFLYIPILNAIDEREKGIAEELANGEKIRITAQRQKEEYDRKKNELDQESAAFLKEAKDEGLAEKQRLLKETQEETEDLRVKIREVLAEEKKTLLIGISIRTRDQVLAITRKVLADLAGSNLEEQMVVVFIQRLHDLSSEEIKVLTSAAKAEGGSLIIRTTGIIAKEQQKSIEMSFKEILGTQPKVTYQSSPELICGIEMEVNGQKVAWSIDDYLSSTEEGCINGSK